MSPPRVSARDPAAPFASAPHHDRAGPLAPSKASTALREEGFGREAQLPPSARRQARYEKALGREAQLPTQRSPKANLITVGQPGLENAARLCIDGVSSGYGDAAVGTAADGAQNTPDASAIGPAFGPRDENEAVLMRALDAAAAAGLLDVVERLERELEARRLERLAHPTDPTLP